MEGLVSAVEDGFLGTVLAQMQEWLCSYRIPVDIWAVALFDLLMHTLAMALGVDCSRDGAPGQYMHASR
jgi:hypothetical protein